MNLLEKFFFWCSGVSTELLLSDACKTEKAKYFWVGTAVFFTGCMAAIAGGFALSFVLKTGDAPLSQNGLLICIFFGIFWWSLIFFLDRFIVASMKKSMSFWKQLLHTLPRMVMAIFIGFVISIPLELKIFATEIDKTLRENQITANRESYLKNGGWEETQAMANAFSGDLSIAEKEVEEAKNLMDAHSPKRCNGTTRDGTNYIYTCESYQNRIDAYNAATERRDNLRTLRNTSLEEIKAKSEELVNQELHFWINERISALYSLPTHTHWFIAILFILIELTPVITKLIMPKWPYDIILEAHEKWVQAESIGKHIDAQKSILQASREMYEIHEETLSEAVNDSHIKKSLISSVTAGDLETAKNLLDKWWKSEVKKVTPKKV